MYKISLKYLLVPCILIMIVSAFTLSWMILILGIATLVAVLVRYYFYKVILTEDSIIIESGILIKQKNEILYSKINNIDVTQNPLQNVFKTATIVVRTGNDGAIEISSMDNYLELYTKIREKFSNNKT